MVNEVTFPIYRVSELFLFLFQSFFLVVGYFVVHLQRKASLEQWPVWKAVP